MRRLAVPAVSLALLTPCFWQPRIQAGDLSSHIYNAWLASLIEQGRAPGLTFAPQWTNILCGLTLPALAKIAGYAAAQRILVACAVLLFSWGAFALARVLSGRPPWFLMPCVAMLAYGWVFHMGFLDFFVSMGLCLWALAALWSGRKLARLAALPLAALAVAAHALPVAWALAVAGYAWLAPRSRRAWLPPACALAVSTALGVLLRSRFATYGSPAQVFFISGADQVWIYGLKYVPVALCLLLLWAALLARLVEEKGMPALLARIPFQAACLTAAGILAIPVAVHLPQYRHTLWFITDRMSLAVAVLLVAVLASVDPGRVLKTSIGVLAAVYFSFLYLDARALNRTEDRMEALLSTLKPGDRVVSSLSVERSRMDPFVHMIDRACIGRCFSYGNYEPSTGQFPIRAAEGSPLVMADYADVYRLQHGEYVVRERDLPLWRLGLCGIEMCLLPTRAGQRLETIAVNLKW